MLFVRDFMMCSSIPCTARGVGGCGGAAVRLRARLRGVQRRLRMLVHGGFTHYRGPAASWGANQDDQREPQPAQAPMIFTSSRLMYSSAVHQSLSHIDPPLNEPSPLCTMSNN